MDARLPTDLMRRGLAAQRVLRGESPEKVAAEHYISVEELEQWRRFYIGDRGKSPHTLKRMIARSPAVEMNLKRAWHRWQIWRGRFRSEEPEFEALEQVVRPGDWALDIGANIGTYTRRLSELVGPTGRVIAFEPMARTFELLVANTADRDNISLCNLAVSDVWHTVSMNVPRFGSGLLSYANATITAGPGISVLAVALDDFAWPTRIALIKLDAEGHEPEVLRGLRRLLERDRPTLIVEFNTPLTNAFLEQISYAQCQLPNGAHVFQAR